uniref:UDP-glucuronic acid 4-epimerase 2 n=1 Tax=Rhizophora mucronata TaxID=61149 RepID=A0A2P2PVP0_RHIMU
MAGCGFADLETSSRFTKPAMFDLT